MSLLFGPRRALLGAREFSPASVVGLSLWLKAGVGMYTDSAMTIPATNDLDVIGGWQDQSGNDYHVTQAAAAKKPTLRLNIVNGKPVARFDGVDDLLVNATAVWQADQSGLMLIVANINAARAVFSSADQGGNTRYLFFEGTTEITQRNADVADSVSGGVGAGAWHLLEFGSTAVVFKIFIDTVDQDPLVVGGGANNGDWFGDTLLRDNFAVGALKRVAEAHWITGDIAELLYYDNYPSAADRQAIRGYLNLEYAIY